MRSTTSFCSMNTWSTTCGAEEIRWNRIGDEMLYGRLPTTRIGPPRRGASAPKSTFNTSDSTTSRSPRRRRRAARSRSSSMTVSASQCCRSGIVIAPRPGPISTRRSPGFGAIALTMRSMTSAAVRKCWPKSLRAMCAMRVARSNRGVAVFDERLGPQVRHPFGVGRVELLFLQRVGRLLAQLLRVDHGIAAVEHRPQMDAEARAHRARQAGDRQLVHRLLELGHERAGRRPAEVAAGLRAAVFRILARHFLERLGAAGDLLAEVEGAG